MALLLAAPLVAWPISAAVSAPEPAARAAQDPTACTGYAEPRVYLESQSWWEPQIGAATHPGTGKQGHIHVETCFPLYQHFGATGTVPFDITVRLHNMPAPLKFLDVWAYGDHLERLWNINWQCPAVDCVRQFRIDLPLDKLKYSGLHALMIAGWVEDQTGARQYTLPRWPVYIDNGKPAPPPDSVAGRTAAALAERGVVGDSWHENDDASGNYAGVAIAREDFPWDPATGQNIPKSGVWTPKVGFEKTTGFAYLDAQLHANPPTKTVVYEGQGRAWPENNFTNLRIDTTTLPDGPHKLLIGTCNTLRLGEHCGTQVIRFTVKNHPDAPPAALRDSTRPVLSRLSISPKRFRAARSMRKRAGAAAARLGTKISYMLSEDAAVKFRLQRAIPGRRSRGRCVNPKRASRHARRCTRYKLLRGSIRRQGHDGMNQMKFKGRLRLRQQRPDRYRLRAVATDPSGNRSRPRTARFRIVRG